MLHFSKTVTKLALLLSGYEHVPIGLQEQDSPKGVHECRLRPGASAWSSGAERRSGTPTWEMVALRRRKRWGKHENDEYGTASAAKENTEQQ
eukprot:gene12756-biopygen1940